MKRIKLFALLSIFSLLMACSNEVVDNYDDSNNSSSSGDGNSNNLKTGQVEMKGYPDDSNRISFIATAKKITINWGNGKIDEFTPNGVERKFTYEYLNSNYQTILINAENLTYIGSITPDKNVPPGSGGAVNAYKYNELRFGDCPNLEQIKFPFNRLTVLDIKKAGALKILDCFSNSLTKLNLNGCKALETLDCAANLLTELDVSGLTALKYLDCGSISDNGINRGYITSLNVSGCVALEMLYCQGNQLTAEELNKVFKSLPTIATATDWWNIIISSNPGASTCDESIATSKGWKVAK